jgi:hypothetical protein
MVMKRPDVSLTRRWLDADAGHEPEECNWGAQRVPDDAGITTQKAKHEGLVSLATFQKIQDRNNDVARVRRCVPILARSLAQSEDDHSTPE